MKLQPIIFKGQAVQYEVLSLIPCSVYLVAFCGQGNVQGRLQSQKKVIMSELKFESRDLIIVQ
jgi:hypothetical protein